MGNVVCRNCCGNLGRRDRFVCDKMVVNLEELYEERVGDELLEIKGFVVFRSLIVEDVSDDENENLGDIFDE